MVAFLCPTNLAMFLLHMTSEEIDKMIYLDFSCCYIYTVVHNMLFLPSFTHIFINILHRFFNGFCQRNYQKATTRERQEQTETHGKRNIFCCKILQLTAACST